MQLVKLLRDGEVVRMSKRTGKAISLSDLLDEVSVDAARWYFNAKPDTQMEFDLGLAVREDSDCLLYTSVSAGEESAFELKRMLKARELRADERRRGETEFYVSDRVEDFERTASLFLQEDLRHTARRIDIERY